MAISCRQILADFYRDVEPQDSGWVYNAIEWINWALNEIGGGFTLELTHDTFTVANHMVAIPCDSKCIKAIIYNGYPLGKYNTINIDQYVNATVEFWNEQSPRYIRTSFQDGEVEIYYYRVVSEYDEALGINLPIIPDDGNNQVRLLLQEYILYKWLGKGNYHPVRTYAEVKAGIYTQWGNGMGLIDRARAALQFPKPYDMEMLKNSLTTLRKDYEKVKYEWFNSENGANTTGEGTTVSTQIITNDGYVTINCD